MQRLNRVRRTFYDNGRVSRVKGASEQEIHLPQRRYLGSAGRAASDVFGHAGRSASVDVGRQITRLNFIGRNTPLSHGAHPL
jgi:hypothetical protein